ncbi:MAG: ArsR family transcriptional regulator [Euryarchaeota archaeon]|jgi:predicted transcriptional regulator|nr:ArsR family transcriptional regulator [Euryarchaeota archaeon]
MEGVAAVRFFSLLAVISLVAGASMTAFSTDNGDDFKEEPNLAQFLGDNETAATDEDAGAAEGADQPEPRSDEQPSEESGDDSDSDDLSRNLMVGGAGVLGTMALGAAFSEVMKVTVLVALVAPMLARIKKTRDDLLTRGRLLGYLEANAGIHFSALRDALGLANGVTAYHLQTLEGEGRIISWRDGKLRRYAIGHLSKSELKRIRNPITGTRLAILEVLSNSGALGLSGTEISNKLEISRQLLSYHLSELKQSDLIGPANQKKRPKWCITEVGNDVLSVSLEVSRLEAGA